MCNLLEEECHVYLPNISPNLQGSTNDSCLGTEAMPACQSCTPYHDPGTEAEKYFDHAGTKTLSL